MLSIPEKIIFTLAVFVSAYFTWRGVKRIIDYISQGHGHPNWRQVPKRLVSSMSKFVTLSPTWKLRPVASTFHALVAWGFTFYLLVNLGDVLNAFIPNFQFLGTGILGDLYRLIADLLSVAALVGMVALMLRRFVLSPRELTHAEDTLLHPKAQVGIRRDSAIVGVFILLHVGFRFLGESFLLASEMHLDPWQPLASGVSKLWVGLPTSFSSVMVHISFWMALGLILAFMPYFPHSKHIHLVFAPLNFLLKPERRSMGELSALDFEDESIEQFGALQLSDLGWEQIMDAYACIMCNRCTEVCPANTTGKVLSPAALEINKRYYLNYDVETQHPEGASLLTEFAISEEAVWACTACGACVDICPVGNEPMRDILDIRRGLVLMENNFPEQWQTAFRGMERSQNPWNIPPSERMVWAEGLHVPTIVEKPNPEYLWWVGCAPATDARAQKTTRAFAKILNHAGVDYAVLGKQESCTGDSARRAGNEYLFYELAMGNVELFNEIKPQKIITTCPHCLHTILNEYPAFGGQYEVVHHTQLINNLIASGKLTLEMANNQPLTVTYHDPCFLGRQNGILIEPRDVITHSGNALREMPRSGTQSFCCGAGGAQMWKEEEHGQEGVNTNRFREAQDTDADILAVGCPFCMVMMNDASKDASSDMQVLDIAEIVAAQLLDM
jgi:Fe-S oxidoreductase